MSNSHFSYQLMCKGDFTPIISSQFMSRKVYWHNNMYTWFKKSLSDTAYMSGLVWLTVTRCSYVVLLCSAKVFSGS